jgi:hypothetical protein
MTTIAACLAWYDEPPRFLERMAHSLEGVVDVLVSCDGPWQHFPHTGVNSPDEQHNALSSALNASGVPHVEMPYHGVWESQVAKRSALYGYAAEQADWLLLIDGDEHITHTAPDLHTLLNLTVEDAALVSCVTVERQRRRSRPRPVHRLFRAVPGIHVTGWHNGIRHPDGTWQHGPPHIRRTKAAPADLTAALTITHHHNARPPSRTRASHTYYRTRTRHRLERQPA